MAKTTLEDFRQGYRILEYWAKPFDLLDAELQHSLEGVQRKVRELKYDRDPLATAKVKYRIYWEPEVTDTGADFLGSIELRKIDDGTTEVVRQRLVRRHRAIPYERVVSMWKAYVQLDKETAQAVREREARKTSGAKPPRRPAGRRHFPEDIWAHEQVNTEHRLPADVYPEWERRAEKARRDLTDPMRQFRRIIKPEWGTK